MSANETSQKGLSAPTPEQEEMLSLWRALALEKMPYFSRMLFSLRVLNAPGLGTYAVDKFHRLYIDFEAVEPKGRDFNVESLLHECSHLFQDHAALAENLAIKQHDFMVWNYAADASINDDLVASGCNSFVKFGDPLPERFGQPNWQTAPFYYSALKKAQEQQQKRQGQGQPQQGQGDQQGQQNAQGQSQNGQQGGQGQQQQGGGSGMPEAFKGCGSASGGMAAPCELSEDNDLNGVAPAASAIEKDQIQQQTAGAVREAAAKSRGTVPAGFVEQAERILAPSKTPWQRVLSSHIRRAVASRSGKYDVDHAKRSRRRHRSPIRNGSGAVLGNVVYPGTYEPIPSIEIVRDTSGSMSMNDLNVACAEIESIAKKIGVRGDNLVVTDVDSEVHSPVRYTGFSSIAGIKGRGGTDMSLGIEAAATRKQKPTAIVVITDGFTPWPAEKPSVPVVGVIVGSEEVFESLRAAQDGGTPSYFTPPSWLKLVHVDPSGTEQEAA